MRNILAEPHREVLARLAAGKPLLAFDFDGTLAPIIADRAAAAMSPATRELLHAVAGIYDCVVITGRSRSDMLRRVTGIDRIEVVGNHGMEPSDDEDRFAAVADAWFVPLHRSLSGLAGVDVEHKHLSLSVHYRQADDPNAALRTIRAAITRHAAGARVMEGNAVVNLVPVGAPHKGTAIVRLMREHARGAALFAGDDTTDEDVFAIAEDNAIVGVRVGESAESRARYFIPAQPDIDRLLHILINLAPGTAGAAAASSIAEPQ